MPIKISKYSRFSPLRSRASRKAFKCISRMQKKKELEQKELDRMIANKKSNTELQTVIDDFEASAENMTAQEYMDAKMYLYSCIN